MSDVIVDRRPAGQSPIHAAPISTLEALRSEMTSRTPVRTVTLEVESRPGFSITFGLKLEQQRLAAWREQSKDELAPGGFNAATFHRTIVAYMADSINHDGAPVVDERGAKVNFKTESFLRSLGVADPIEAVERFYDNDFHVESAANKIVNKAGFAKEAKEVDPTRPQLKS